MPQAKLVSALKGLTKNSNIQVFLNSKYHLYYLGLVISF